MTPEEALDFIVTRYGNDPGVEEALCVLLADKELAPSVDEGLLAAAKEVLATACDRVAFQGGLNKAENTLLAAIQRAEARKAPPDYDAIIGTFISTKDLFAAKAPEKPSPVVAKVKKHDGPCWRNSHADCGC